MSLRFSPRADLELWDFHFVGLSRRSHSSSDPPDSESFPFFIQEISYENKCFDQLAPLSVPCTSLPQNPDEIGGMAQRFQHLAKIWRNESAHLSSVREMVLHPAYQQIVGMGPSALPYIFAELEREPDHWFWALRAITGEDPVPPEHRGNVARMSQNWLCWAEKEGIRW